MELITTVKPALYEGGNTKKEIESLALLIVEETLQKGTPIELAEKIAATENLIKTIKDNSRFTDYVKEELAKTQGKYSTESGTRIEACEAGVKYHYDKTNDPVLNGLMADMEVLKAKVKQREDFLKTVPVEGLDIRHEDELVTVYPPYKTSASTYKITLAK